MLMRTTGFVVFLSVVPVLATGQTTTAVRVLRTSVIVEQPVGDAAVLGSVVPGEMLEVLDQRGEWYMVRPSPGLDSPQWRTGWINRATVEPVDFTFVDDPARTPSIRQSEETGETTAGRQGFIIGLGAGVGRHQTPGFAYRNTLGRVYASTPGSSTFAFVTDFKLGYAPSDQILMYYSNKAVFSRDSRYDVLGVTGFGTTYMLKRTSPTAYVGGSIGAAAGGNLQGLSNPDFGLGFTVGGGYEFSRHLSLNGDAMVLKLADGRRHTIFTTTFNYLFY